MSGKELLEGMSYVDERFVDEAENMTIGKGNAVQWKRWLTVAACLCILGIGVASFWNMMPFHTQNSSESAAGDQMMGQENWTEGAAVANGAGEIPDQETVKVPSFILRVEALHDGGFTGTVASPEDTDIFEMGMELNVVVAEDAGFENQTGNEAASQDESDTKLACEIGSLVHVQFVSYDEETNTVVVNLLGFIEEPTID